MSPVNRSDFALSGPIGEVRKREEQEEVGMGVVTLQLLDHGAGEAKRVRNGLESPRSGFLQNEINVRTR